MKIDSPLTPCGDLDYDGWLSGARRVDSPNFDARPAGEDASLIVVHAISLPPRQFGSDDIVRLFTNTLDSEAHPYFATISGLRVSAHFLIRRDGELLQFVSCHERAWHAGVSVWNGRERCNDFSLGIELEGCDDLPFADVQYRRLAALVALLRARYPIAALVGHADVAPGRKTDPGPLFDWRRIGGRMIVQTAKEAVMATDAKSKPDTQEEARAEPAATPPESVRKASAKKLAGSDGGDKKKASKTKAVEKQSAKPAGKSAGASAKAAKAAKGRGAATKGAAAVEVPVNPAIAWPFPLGPRPQ